MVYTYSHTLLFENCFSSEIWLKSILNGFFGSLFFLGFPDDSLSSVARTMTIHLTLWPVQSSPELSQCTFQSSLNPPPPPFCNLSLNTNHRGGGGGLYTGCDNFSRNYTLPSGKHDLIVVGGWELSTRQRNAPDISGRLTSFSVKGWGSRALLQSSKGGEGGGLMCGIKIPQQDFALKMMQGGLMHEGGHICGTLWCTCVPRPA